MRNDLRKVHRAQAIKLNPLEKEELEFKKLLNVFDRYGNLCILRSEVKTYTKVLQKKGVKIKVRDLIPASKRCVIIERVRKSSK